MADEGVQKGGMSPIKIIGILIVVFILAAILGVAYIYFGVIKPLQGLDIQPQGARPVGLSPLTFQGVIIIGNPGGDTTIPRIDLDLYVDDTYMGTGVIPETTITGGSMETVTTTFVSELTVTELRALINGKDQVGIKVGGKIHSNPISIPIPAIPVPVDTTEFVASLNALEESPVVGLVETLEENADMAVSEALDDPEFRQQLEELAGRQLSDQDIQLLRQSLEQQGMADMTVEEFLSDPQFMAMVEGQ